MLAACSAPHFRAAAALLAQWEPLRRARWWELLLLAVVWSASLREGPLRSMRKLAARALCQESDYRRAAEHLRVPRKSTRKRLRRTESRHESFGTRMQI